MTELPLHAFELSEDSPSGLVWAVDICCGHGYKQVKYPAGSRAGSRRKDGRWTTTYKQKGYLCARIIYALRTGEDISDKLVDHINGDVSDHSPDNLRAVSYKLNARNMGMKSSNVTGVTGVHYENGRNGRSSAYVAELRLDGKRKGRAFSVDRYGSDEAFRLACHARQQFVSQANAAGAGLTERHGNGDS